MEISRKELKRIYQRIDKKFDDLLGDIRIVVETFEDNYPLQEEVFSGMALFLIEAQEILHEAKRRNIL